MATIKDVAAHSGVSTTTVSHVINQTRFVAEATQERVYAAMAELNYAPSAVARSLKVRATRTIGMMVTTSANPFFAEVVRGVEEHCHLAGYNLVLCNSSGDPEKQLSNLRMLVEKRVDGLLIMCSDSSPDLYRQLEAYKYIPQVVMDWGPNCSHADRIQDNSEVGGYRATRHLIELGHQAIGCICGPMDKLPNQQRIGGFKRALQEAGLPINASWLIEGDYEAEGGYAAMQKLLALKQRPSALFVMNDMMALGVMCCAHQHGVSIPEQMSIVGYDDMPMTKYFTPPLTTVNQPKFELGQRAAQTLLNRIKEPRDSGRVLLMDPELKVRDSSASI